MLLAMECEISFLASNEISAGLLPLFRSSAPADRPVTDVIVFILSKMSKAPLLDNGLQSMAPAAGYGVTAGLSLATDIEQITALCFVGLLLLFLVFLLVRCFRILLDPYGSMPASSWNDHKDGLRTV
ncbi:cortexin-1 [Tachysurus ichikawai]